MSNHVIRFTIPGKPHGHQRHRARVVQAGKRSFAQFYDTVGNKAFKALCQQKFTERDISAWDPTGPMELDVTAVFNCTKAPRKREPHKESWRVKKPDLDNIVKAVMDALNGLGYLDDSQVVIIHARKYEARQGEPARLHVGLSHILDGMHPPG